MSNDRVKWAITTSAVHPHLWSHEHKGTPLSILREAALDAIKAAETFEKLNLDSYDGSTRSRRDLYDEYPYPSYGSYGYPESEIPTRPSRPASKRKTSVAKPLKPTTTTKKASKAAKPSPKGKYSSTDYQPPKSQRQTYLSFDDMLNAAISSGDEAPQQPELVPDSPSQVDPFAEKKAE